MKEQHNGTEDEREFSKSLEELKADEQEALRAQLEPMARKRVKAMLLLEAIAEKEKCDVTQADLDAETARTARDLRISLTEAKRLLGDREETQEGLKAVLRRQKALDLIMSKAVVATAGD